jgi:hypothetical protein
MKYISGVGFIFPEPQGLYQKEIKYSPHKRPLFIKTHILNSWRVLILSN